MESFGLKREAEKDYLESSNAYFHERQKQNPGALIGVAEGDSWFDYKPAWLDLPVKGDLIGLLQKTGRYNIYRVSRAGDTLENMIYGTDYNDANWNPYPGQIHETLRAIKSYTPAFFLFSGGGNDFSGQELEAFLNHRHSGMETIREGYVELMFEKVIPKAMEDLFVQIFRISPKIHIFLHGYGYAVPTGKGIFQLVPGWQFAGPWLRPAFTKKRVLEMKEMRAALNRLIDDFNEMLARLAASDDRIHHVDLRASIKDDHWGNELHLNAEGWKAAAGVFDAEIQSVLGF